ncbi:MAG: hypothetical protein ACP5KX_03750 [Caldisericia bacterium]
MIDYEFRTTICPGLDEEDILGIMKIIKGAKRYCLQKYQNRKILNPVKEKNYKNMISDLELDIIKEEILDYIGIVEIR